MQLQHVTCLAIIAPVPPQQQNLKETENQQLILDPSGSEVTGQIAIVKSGKINESGESQMTFAGTTVAKTGRNPQGAILMNFWI